MMLCYLYRTGTEPEPELCLIAEKLDQFSPPIAIESLKKTAAAVVRIGPLEAANISFDSSDGGLVVDPCLPSKLYLSPPQPDLPGFRVTRLKVVKVGGEERYQTFFQLDKEEWKQFNPPRDCR